MLYILKKFDELTTIELYDILRIRSLVFVLEQNCPYLDVDDLDQAAQHIMLRNDEGLLGAYCRIISPGIKYDEYVCISRVVSSPELRREGWGRRLMPIAIKACQELFPHHDIKISAQLYLKKFYESFGFQQVSEEYLEDDIPHIAMIKLNKI